MFKQHKALMALPILGLATALTLSACGGSGDTKTGSPSKNWSFTDDRGVTVKLDHRPEKVVAFADQALALHAYGVDVVGIIGRTDIKKDSRFKNWDLSKVSIYSTEYGAIDFAKMAEDEPDVIVTGDYPTKRNAKLGKKDLLYGFNDAASQKKAEKLAPTVGMEVGGKGADVVERMSELAVDLGAKQSRVEQAKKRFDAAGKKLKAAAKARPEIEVTQMYADKDGLFVVKPQDEPATQLLSEYGVNYTNLNPGGEYYWDKYSWENASKMMTGDVIFTQQDGLQAADLAKQETFKDDPALKAGQVQTWADATMDYASQAKQMATMTKTIEDAENVVK
jgi:iron complex transport system substrate-binding protein